MVPLCMLIPQEPRFVVLLLRDLIPDEELWEKDFVSLVERRGWVLLNLRDGVSSVLSVARASIVVARWLFQGSNVATSSVIHT